MQKGREKVDSVIRRNFEDAQRLEITNALEDSKKFREAMKISERKKSRSERMKGDDNPMRRLDVRKKISNRNKLKVGIHAYGYKNGNSFVSGEVKRRDNFKCKRCGCDDITILQVDHDVPLRVDRSLEFVISNLQLLCPNCHARKSKEDKEKYGF